jgi:2-C-methyl-D-erythritol 4-phosphate cytidylyltransferase
VREAERTGAAILAIPAAEPIVTSRADGSLSAGGEDLWVAQTPQAFSARLVLDAHRRADAEGFVGTDTSSVVERTGHPVAVLEGSGENLKITTSDDLLRAELIAARQRGDSELAGLGALTPRV